MGDREGWKDGVPEMICATLATLRQFKLIQGKTNLSAAMSACLPQCRLIHRNVDLSGAKSTYPARFKVIHGESTLSRPKQSYPGEKQSYPGKNKIIWADPTLSTAKQSYPPQSQLVYRKIDLSAAKSPDIAADKSIGGFRRSEAGQGDVSAGWSVEGLPYGVSSSAVH
jgi:hypothetical protein